MAGVGDFDPQDKNSWYFGPMSRDEANALLDKDGTDGVFLVRDSSTIKGDFVLCVKEENKNSHYIINKIMVSGVARFRIGDQEFNDLPALLLFYKTHYLDKVPLIRPVGLEFRDKYVGKYDFPGRDPEDLPFVKEEILIILRRDEEQWWTARNERGQCGQVPVPYLEKLDPNHRGHSSFTTNSVAENVPEQVQQRQLPARARVIRARIPNAYDQKAITLVVGEEILVTAMNINGTWEGKGNGKEGQFPFNCVKFIDSDNEDDAADS